MAAASLAASPRARKYSAAATIAGRCLGSPAQHRCMNASSAPATAPASATGRSPRVTTASRIDPCDAACFPVYGRLLVHSSCSTSPYEYTSALAL